jgi:hypothetical protein
MKAVQNQERVGTRLKQGDSKNEHRLTRRGRAFSIEMLVSPNGARKGVVVALA